MSGNSYFWDSTATATTSTTDWDFTAGTSSTNTWYLNITINCESDDKYENCGGYIP